MKSRFATLGRLDNVDTVEADDANPKNNHYRLRYGRPITETLVATRKGEFVSTLWQDNESTLSQGC
ncbi:MAG: hypothetical protein M1404_01115 [Acidobacteria bacterium]|nr:hypothetical protein [Acidobacteriota bacterium]